jgi:acetylornithine aminotransferase
MGSWLIAQLGALDGVAEVRGRGLFIGIGLEEPVAARFLTLARSQGIIVNAPRPDTVRLVPPLILTEDQVSPLIEAWPRLYAEARNV